MSTPTTDCDDTRDFVHVGAFEAIDDGRDEDCDGGELCYDDPDDDGYLDALPASRLSPDLDCTDAQEGLATVRRPTATTARTATTPMRRRSWPTATTRTATATRPATSMPTATGFRPDSTTTILSKDLSCTGPGEAGTDDPTGDCDDDDPSVAPGATDDDSTSASTTIATASSTKRAPPTGT